MQIAYFDESGIDGAHDITLIAGFVARLQDWPKIVATWKAQLQADRVPFFHYIDCKNQTGPYKGWNWHKDCLPHLRRMANILTTSPIGGVSAASLGNWKESTRRRSDLQVRFPSAYSFCFEMMMQKIRQEMNFHGQPDITMIFADQRQYNAVHLRCGNGTASATLGRRSRIFAMPSRRT
ncbi:hypothetical protein [Sphingomonas sp. GM_Shp_1]|uniref:hypothetical protein n=1 Tax=Sphingomonas sp. GM_Shp_1 TaxID=2937381 RepID=UPI00226B2806|nr:hypothetical protein [Sphingomonas sp. GM_Shp_1]